MTVHFYPPISSGAFADLLDDLRAQSWNVEHTGDASARASSPDGSHQFKLVSDEDELRAQLLHGDDVPSTWHELDAQLRKHGVAVQGSDARFAYSIAAGTAYSDTPNGATRGVFTTDVGVPFDGILQREGGAVRIATSGADPVWIPESALQSAVLGDDATRWDKLAGELAALDSASAVVGIDAGDASNVDAAPKTKIFSLSPDQVQHLLDGARSRGMDVTKTDDNAWTIDTHTSNVKLDANYDPASQKATITIRAPFYVPNSAVWEKLAPLMPSHVSGADEPTQAAPNTTDAEAHVSYLETAEQKIQNAWDKAKELDDEQKKRVKEAATKAVVTARALAKDVEQGTRDMGQRLHDRAVEIKEKLKQAAKNIGAGWFAGGVATWLVIGGIVYLVFKDEGRREAAKHAAASALV